jgi:succinoglycan biosynthesis protein ExoO
VADIAASDPRVVLIRRTSDGGPAVARNEAIDRARGRWVAILDGDDVIAPGRTRALIDLAEASSADLAGDNYERTRMDGRRTGITMIPVRPQTYQFEAGVADFLDLNRPLEKPGWTLGAIKCLFRRSFLERHRIRHPEDVEIGEDFHFILSCLLAGARLIVTSDVRYFYRMRTNSISWRLTARHVERMIEAFERERVQERFRGDPRVLRASNRYRASLRRAHAYAGIVEHAKAGRWPKALRDAASRRDTWPLLRRFGGYAVMKRARAGAALFARG